MAACLRIKAGLAFPTFDIGYLYLVFLMLRVANRLQPNQHMSPTNCLDHSRPSLDGRPSDPGQERYGVTKFYAVVGYICFGDFRLKNTK